MMAMYKDNPMVSDDDTRSQYGTHGAFGLAVAAPTWSVSWARRDGEALCGLSGSRGSHAVVVVVVVILCERAAEREGHTSKEDSEKTAQHKERRNKGNEG
jgi:hypothetical protein